MLAATTKMHGARFGAISLYAQLSFVRSLYLCRTHTTLCGGPLLCLQPNIQHYSTAYRKIRSVHISYARYTQHSTAQHRHTQHTAYRTPAPALRLYFIILYIYTSVRRTYTTNGASDYRALCAHIPFYTLYAGGECFMAGIVVQATHHHNHVGHTKCM